MQFYKFDCPNQWNGFRNIDEEIDQNKIDQERNFDVGDDQDIVEESPENKDTKSKSSKQKSKKDNDSESSKKKKQ